MTKQDILEYFKDINAMYNECTRYDNLSRMLDELQEPCEDRISRDAVLDLVEDYDLSMGQVVKGIHALSPVTPAEKTGWHIAHGMYEDRFWCSCGYIKVMDSSMAEWKYCPICGAKMQEVEK